MLNSERGRKGKEERRGREGTARAPKKPEIATANDIANIARKLAGIPQGMTRAEWDSRLTALYVALQNRGDDLLD